MNLLEETKEMLQRINKTPQDIEYIGTSNGKHIVSRWRRYSELADKEYDNGYGGHEVCLSLMIKFHDETWISREEYDGSEWWTYNKPPKINNDDHQEMSTLFTAEYDYDY